MPPHMTDAMLARDSLIDDPSDTPGDFLSATYDATWDPTLVAWVFPDGSAGQFVGGVFVEVQRAESL